MMASMSIGMFLPTCNLPQPSTFVSPVTLSPCLLVCGPFYVPQSFGGLLGGDVALGLGQQFEADHELAHGSRAQQRGVEVGVEMPLLVGLAIGGPLVEPHRVRERDLEQIVVARGKLLEDI